MTAGLPDGTRAFVILREAELGVGEGGSGTLPFEASPVWMEADHFALRFRTGNDLFQPRAPGTGILAVAGYAPTELSWGAPDAEGRVRCSPDPIALRLPDAVVEGKVARASGDSFVIGCGGYAPVQPDGSYRIGVRAGGPCLLRTKRWEDVRLYEYREHPVVPVQGGVVHADLALGPRSSSRVGVDYRLHEDGAVVTRLHQADDGFEIGDLIVEVRGVRLAGKGEAEVERLMKGDTLELVPVKVRRGDEILELRVLLTRTLEMDP